MQARYAAVQQCPLNLLDGIFDIIIPQRASDLDPTRYPVPLGSKRLKVSTKADLVKIFAACCIFLPLLVTVRLSGPRHW